MKVDEDDLLATATTAWQQILDGYNLDTFRAHRTGCRDIHISPENLRDSRPWGDVMVEKQSDSIRLFCQNVNGLKLDAQGGDYTALCHMTSEIQADVVCITEHNLDSTKHHVNQTCYDSLKNNLPRSRMTIGSSPIKTKGTYKPGGTLMLAQGTMHSRFKESGADELGRWTYQTYAAKDSEFVTFVTAYQVCNKTHT